MIPQAFGFIGSLRIKVGTFYQGGIVVYIDRGTKQGLIAQNQFTTDGLEFAPNGAFTQTAGYGNGYANTQNAYNALTPGSNTALYTAWNSTLNGYSDWFLPNRAEAAYIAQVANTGFGGGPLSFWNGGTIWLSESSSNTNAYVYDRNFPGAPFLDNKTRSETGNRRSIACRYMTFT
jgi:hypothetical protein